MWPWMHLVFGYVLYRIFRWIAGANEPADWKALVLLSIGTQFPDIIDKPLAWSVAILPTGRSLAHSVFTATIVIALFIAYTRWIGHSSYGYGFGVGYGSHLIGDGIGPLLSGDINELAYLLWPALPPVEYETPPSFAAHFATLEFTPLLAIKLAITASVLIIIAHRSVTQTADVEE